jgi:hypothetical protein
MSDFPNKLACPEVGQRYTEKQLQAIIDKAPVRIPQAVWEKIELSVVEYIDTLPRLTQARARWFEGRSREFIRKLKDCSLEQRPKILEFVDHLSEIQAWATDHCRGGKKRADPAQEAFIVQIAAIYLELGGYAGKDRKSPCALFVTALVEPIVLKATGRKPISVAHVIRTQVWRDLEQPALMINPNEFFPLTVSA